MKKFVPLIVLFLLADLASAQIVTPVIKANFGVDADLRANYFNGAIDAAGKDDWFDMGTPGTGVFVIDTTGAAYIQSQYLVDSNYRKKSFVRGMAYPMYSTINGKLFYDALYVRDHFKTDSSSFISSNKNGQSPAVWTGGYTPVPVKNDINDMMLHVRRDGPNLTDSLWLFAGLSLLGSTGNRYFDIELYQSDMYYNPADNKFHNYGNEAGHTAWQFDASGNVTKPGDVIFTAEFGSSSLTLLQARIWVHKSVITAIPNPTQFSWGGAFDGDGSAAQYGYASILPKTGGVFYCGNQTSGSAWGGPFGFMDPANIAVTNYSDRQFMEIAVNMTKIGLDPYTILGNSCNLSFRKVFAKTRTSTSFTSSLTDFVGPYAIATAPLAVATGDITLFCGSGPGSSQLFVVNPLATSTYTWNTTDGHIVTSPATGTSIVADQPGSYIVTQSLHSSCAPYATDTVTIIRDEDRCMILASEDIRFTGRNNHPLVLLNWVAGGKDLTRFDVQRSIDGRNFQSIAAVQVLSNGAEDQSYQTTDQVNELNSQTIYYRLKIVRANGQYSYSSIVKIKNSIIVNDNVSITPNPARGQIQLMFEQAPSPKTSIHIFSSAGQEVHKLAAKNKIEKIDIAKLTPGIYFVQAFSEGSVIAQKKILVAR